MKNIAKYLFAIAAAAFTITACEKETEVKPGEPEVDGCYGVFFPKQDALGDHTYDPEMAPEVDITVSRLVSEGDITVPFKVTASEEDIFDFGTLTFADGQSEATLHVDFSKAKEGTPYSFSVTIDGDQYASKYGKGAISADFSVLIVSWLDFLNPVTNEPAEITLNEGWWGEVHMAKMRYYEVDGIRTCRIYSIEDGNGIWGDTVDAGLEFIWYTKNTNGNGHQLLQVPKQYFGFDYDGWGSKPVGEATSPIFVYDYYSYWIERGESESTIGTFLDFAKKYGEEDGSYPIGYYDGNGGFIFNLRYYIPGLGGFSPDPYEFQALADGFTRVDYSLKLTQPAVSSNSEVSVAFELGTDVAKAFYEFKEGTLSNIQIENTVAAMNLKGDNFVDATGVYAFNLEKTGVYTLVVAGVDAEGKVQNTASLVVKYLNDADAEEYAVVVNGGLASAEKYIPQGVNPDNSLEFFIYGSDLVQVKMGVYSVIEMNDPDACVADLLDSDDLDAAALEAINGDGYVDVVTGLIPGTEFYMLVYANNGYAETVELFGPATTSGDPLPIYMDYTTADYYSDGEFASRENVIGTWNYYGTDAYGSLGLREYLGKVTFTASETETEGPDDSGLYDEYVYATGLFGDLSWLGSYNMSTAATVEMDVYGGIIYNFSDTTVEGDYSVYLGAKAQDSWGYTLGYGAAFIPVADGYYAFVDVSKYAATYNFCGLGLYSTAGWIAKVWDPLLVDPAKDENGLANSPALNAQINRAASMFAESLIENEHVVMTQEARSKVVMASYAEKMLHGSYGHAMGLKGLVCPTATAKVVSVKYVGAPVKIEKAERVLETR